MNKLHIFLCWNQSVIYFTNIFLVWWCHQFEQKSNLHNRLWRARRTSQWFNLPALPEKYDNKDACLVCELRLREENLYNLLLVLQDMNGIIRDLTGLSHVLASVQWTTREGWEPVHETFISTKTKTGATQILAMSKLNPFSTLRNGNEKLHFQFLGIGIKNSFPTFGNEN